MLKIVEIYAEYLSLLNLQRFQTADYYSGRFANKAIFNLSYPIRGICDDFIVFERDFLWLIWWERGIYEKATDV